MPKKTAAARRKTGPAKRGPGRPKGSKNKSTAKKSAAKNVKKPASKKGGGRGGFNREMNDEVGFAVGTDQEAIALALMEGGESRADIVERLEGELDLETRNGTDKQITNMVSGVLNKMLDRGFLLESSFQVLPPTPASKRAATAARNKAAKKPAKKAASRKPAKKTAAKKTAAKGKKGKAARSRRR